MPQQAQDPAPKKSPLKRLVDKLGLDPVTIITMIRGSIPTTIALAMYQSHAVAHEYETLGYLVAIATILGLGILPRGKFIQHMLLMIVAVAFGYAFTLLALFSGIKARQHNSAPGLPPNAYNASASAVLAVWLSFGIYLAFSLRSARPQFSLPVIGFSIFMCIGILYGTGFPTMPYAVTFMTRILKAFYTGFALTTAVSLVVIPITSRMVLFKEMTGFIMSLNGTLKMQGAYMQISEATPNDPSLRTIAELNKQVNEIRRLSQ